MPIAALQEFLQKESAGGLLIIAAAVLAMLAEHADTAMRVDNRLGILGGSVLSAIIGYLVLSYALGGNHGADTPQAHTGTPGADE